MHINTVETSVCQLSADIKTHIARLVVKMNLSELTELFLYFTNQSTMFPKMHFVQDNDDDNSESKLNHFSQVNQVKKKKNTV